MHCGKTFTPSLFPNKNTSQMLSLMHQDLFTLPSESEKIP